MLKPAIAADRAVPMSQTWGFRRVVSNQTSAPGAFDPESIRSWIREGCSEMEITPSAWARQAGLRHSTLTRFLKGNGPKNLTGSSLFALSKARVAHMGMSQTWGAISPKTGRLSAIDPIYAQIELHRALVHRVNTMPDEDGSPVFQAACDIEEATLQALGDMVPTTVDAAIDQLCYIAEVEGCFTDDGSPFLRTVLSVVKGLSSLSGRVAA